MELTIKKITHNQRGINKLIGKGGNRIHDAVEAMNVAQFSAQLKQPLEIHQKGDAAVKSRYAKLAQKNIDEVNDKERPRAPIMIATFEDALTPEQLDAYLKEVEKLEEIVITVDLPVLKEETTRAMVDHSDSDKESRFTIAEIGDLLDLGICKPLIPAKTK